MQVGGLGDQGVNLFHNFVWQARRHGSLVCAQPDVVGDVAQCAVAVVDVQNSTETVLEEVPTTRLQGNAIDVEPSAPKGSRDEVHVAVDHASGVVAEADVDLGLDVEVHYTEDTLRRQERRE